MAESTDEPSASAQGSGGPPLTGELNEEGLRQLAQIVYQMLLQELRVERERSSR